MKPSTLFSAAILSIASLLATTSFAASDSKEDAAQALLNKVTQGQIKILKRFDSGNNLVGFLIKPSNPQEQGQGQETIVYVDKEGKYMFAGVMFDKNGENQTAQDAQQYIVSPLAGGALEAAKSTAWVLDGSPAAKHTIYAIGDPNCIYCYKFYQMMRPYVESKQVAIRWIWVGIIKAQSAGMAQAILQAPNPAELMAQNENNFSDKDEMGGIKSLDKPSKETLDKFNKNMQFIKDFEFMVTPVVLYQDGTEANLIFGLPTGKQKDDFLQFVQSK